MTAPKFLLLYVDNPTRSGEFYSRLLARPPVEASPTFHLFALDSGWMLGLWSKHTVEPGATAVGGSELAFSVADNNTVRNWHADWMKRGLPIVQAPTEMDFGFTFVATDPDGHRLRVFAPSVR